ncbi:hypothetical protein OIU76_028423 [Salix suchowensis]|nr:hypothetical protein OIU76_028423 [Salix suchowensis]
MFLLQVTLTPIHTLSPLELNNGTANICPESPRAPSPQPTVQGPEMATVPVWIKLPNLPLKCWSSTCLSKIVSVVGRPIQSDMLTSSMARLSYACVLVEIDLRKKLRESVAICLPNGVMIDQQIVYETLPKFCSYCKVLGHMVETCSKFAKICGKDKGKEVFSVADPPIPVGGNVGANLAPKLRSGDKQFATVSYRNLHGKGLQQGVSSVVDGFAAVAIEEMLWDPMPAEAATTGGEWEMVKKKHKSNRHLKKFTAVGVVAAAGASTNGVAAVVDTCVIAAAANYVTAGVMAAADASTSGMAAMADTCVVVMVANVVTAADKNVLTVAFDLGTPFEATVGLTNELVSVETST